MIETSIVEQLALLERVKIWRELDAPDVETKRRDLQLLSATIVRLKAHERALAVVEAAREMLAQVRYFPVAECNPNYPPGPGNRLRDAMDAYDATLPPPVDAPTLETKRGE